MLSAALHKAVTFSVVRTFSFRKTELFEVAQHCVFFVKFLFFSPVGLSELILGSMPTEIHTKGSPDNIYLSIKYFRFSGQYLYDGSLKC